MANTFVILLLIFITIQNIAANSLGRCVQENPCVCKFNDYSLVNISDILDNQKPPYLVDADEVNSKFYFSGCKNAILQNNTFSVSTFLSVSLGLS